jgi:hypothetical protein
VLKEGIRRLAAVAMIGLLAVACASPPAADPVHGEPSDSTGQATHEPSPTPGPSGSLGATPSATATPADGGLESGALALTGAEGIRLRSEPAASAAKVNQLRAGTEVIVLSGPVADASDPTLEWWEVQPSDDFCDECPLDPRPGWMSTGPNGDWLRLEEHDCPSISTLTADGWGSYPLLQCFGSDPIALEGIVDYGCCRGITFGTTEPAWLAGDYSDPVVAHLLVSADSEQFWGPELHLAPGSSVTLGDRGTVARIIGHVDDAAAQTCATTLTDEERDLNPELTWVTTPALAVYHCRTQFVVDSVEVLDFVDLPSPAPQG